MHIAYFPLVFTLSLVSISQAHSHEARESLPGSWYHARDHPVNSLFGRAKDDGRPYPAVGTPGVYCIPLPCGCSDQNLQNGRRNSLSQAQQRPLRNTPKLL